MILMAYNKDNDCRGSKGLYIYYNNNMKYYKKQVSNFIKKYILDFVKILSKDLKISMVDYEFVIYAEKTFYFRH